MFLHFNCLVFDLRNSHRLALDPEAHFRCIVSTSTALCHDVMSIVHTSQVLLLFICFDDYRSSDNIRAAGTGGQGGISPPVLLLGVYDWGA